MPSSPIAAILGHRPTDTDQPPAVTDSERQGLLAALSAVADPRDPRGIRYPLASMLATAVCAVMAGACTFAAMADWVRDLDPPGTLLPIHGKALTCEDAARVGPRHGRTGRA